MKKQILFKNLKPFILVLIFMATVLQSCEESKELPFKSNDPYLHIDEYGEYLEENIGKQCVGLQYSIVKNGNLEINKAVGNSRLPINGGYMDYHKLQRKSVHSVSKTISAAALVHILDENDISIDAEIHTFLPKIWNTDKLKQKKVTFKNILQHRSGLRGTKDSFLDMKNYIEAGSFDNKNRKYANVNFSLMRILIPYINTRNREIFDNAYRLVGNSHNLNNVFFKQVATKYIELVAESVLIPVGINENVSPKIWDESQFPIPVYHYNFKNQANEGYIHTDQTLFTGAGGWYMNAKELAAFITYLSADNIQNIDYKWMSDNELGMYKTNRSGVNYITHNGASGDRPQDGTGGRAIWVHIPETDVIVTMQINSATNGFTMGKLVQTIIDGYLAATHI